MNTVAKRLGPALMCGTLVCALVGCDVSAPRITSERKGPPNVSDTKRIVLADEDHLLGHLTSRDPRDRSLSMSDVESDRYVTYAVCEGDLTMRLIPLGANVPADEVQDIVCDGVVNRRTTMFEPDAVAYRELRVQTEGEGTWEVVLGWQDDPSQSEEAE